MEHKELIDKIGREWEEMKALLNGRADEEVKKFGTTLGETTAKLGEYNSRLDGFELQLQKAMQAAAAREVGKNQEKGERYNILMKALRHGMDRLSAAEEQKLMQVGNDTTGGFGSVPEFDTEIIKGVVEISPVRSLVRVRNTSKRSVRVMKRTGTFSAVWVGAEVNTDGRSETDGLRYGMEEIPTHEIYAMVDISKQDLEDTDFDLEAELRMEFAEQFAYAEGVAVLTGSGVSRPEGIITNAAVAIDTTGDASLLTYDGLVDVSHNGKELYLPNARFIFNLRTLGAIRKMKDGSGEPIWAPMSAAAPSSVLGFPYTIVQGMANVAANAKPVLFGDFRRGYQLVDRIALEIERDAVTQMTKGAVRFYARKRMGGQVVLAEALRVLKVAA